MATRPTIENNQRIFNDQLQKTISGINRRQSSAKISNQDSNNQRKTINQSLSVITNTHQSTSNRNRSFGSVKTAIKLFPKFEKLDQAGKCCPFFKSDNTKNECENRQLQPERSSNSRSQRSIRKNQRNPFPSLKNTDLAGKRCPIFKFGTIIKPPKWTPTVISQPSTRPSRV